MRGYFLRRLVLLIPTLIGITIVSFLIIHLAPGDPTALLSDEGHAGVNGAAFQQLLQETRALYGLDQPLYVQYGRWLKRVAVFDFGFSLRDHRPIIDKLAERIPVSVGLTGLSLVLAYLIAIPIGIYSATHPHTRTDRAISVTLFALYSLPTFWVATLGIVYFGGGDFWNIFPVIGLHSPNAATWPMSRYFADFIWHLILPVGCMTYYAVAVVSRYMRAGMIEVIRQDFIRTARAKGLPERTVIIRHALRNSLIPLITITGDVLPLLVGGSIVIETLFTIPGMGLLIYEAVFNRDYPVVMAVFTLSAVLTLIGILVSDFLYTLVDPRISYERQPA
jgi:peptide/nickel transport system permease protein